MYRKIVDSFSFLLCKHVSWIHKIAGDLYVIGEGEYQRDDNRICIALCRSIPQTLFHPKIRKVPSTRANDALYPSSKSSKHALQPLDGVGQKRTKALFIHPSHEQSALKGGIHHNYEHFS